MGHEHDAVRLSSGGRWFLEVGPPPTVHISLGEFVPLVSADELFPHFVPREKFSARRRDVFRAFRRDNSICDVGIL
jgi:hypothetical protein